MASKKFLTFFVIFCLAGWAIAAQPATRVTKSPSSLKGMDARWDWAWKAAKQQLGSKGVYIGYSIQRLMRENSHIGSWSSEEEDNHPTLSELITGKRLAADVLAYQKSPAEVAQTVLDRKKGEEKPAKMVLKEVAFLFEFQAPLKNRFSAERVKVRKLELRADFEEKDLIWLGRMSDDESVSFLSEYFKKSDIEKVRERLIMGLGFHSKSREAFAFIKKILLAKVPEKIRKTAAFWVAGMENPSVVPLLLDVARNDTSSSVRESAVFGLSRAKGEAAQKALMQLARGANEVKTRERALFWLGQKSTDEVVDFLILVAEKDPSQKIREAAIFGLYRNQSPKAVDLLIKLAKKDPDPAVRKRAIFWLAQKAQKSAEVLESLAHDDPETEVQTQAVFALSRIKNGKGIPQLIRIARTHKNREVRKKAIFWLGRSNDPRALKTLIELVKKNSF